jgi:hypothetical protein
MRLRDVAPGEGASWMRRGFQVFFRQPLGFAALFSAYWFVFLLLGAVPWIGGPVTVAIAPTGTLLFFIATRLTLAGGRPVPGAFRELAAGSRGQFVGLAKLGLAYLVAVVAAVYVFSAVDGGAMAQLQDAVSDPNATPEAIAAKVVEPRLQAGALVGLLLGGLLSVPLWHAPGLVFWGGQGWAKAMFSSTVAVWHNKGAFTVYGLAWAGIGLAVSVVLAVVVGLTGAPQVAAAALPVAFFLGTVFYASLWFSFEGCFAADADPAGA